MRFLFFSFVVLVLCLAVTAAPRQGNHRATARCKDEKASSSSKQSDNGVAQGPRTEEEKQAEQQAEQNAGGFEGDIMLTPEQSKELAKHIKKEKEKEEKAKQNKQGTGK